MRTIKFRGQDEDGEWLYGDLRQRLGYWPAIIESYCTDEGKVGYREIAVKEETVGQFTGLKDKNGRDIYEGDILKGGDVIHVVRYFDDESGFVGVVWPFVRDTNGTLLTSALHQWWINMYGKAIIGNIYDNPDLAFWTGDDSEAKDAARRFTEGFEKYAGVKVKPSE